MSHIGRKKIKFPENVTIIMNHNFMKVNGPLGEIKLKLMDGLNYDIIDDSIFITLKSLSSSKIDKSNWGTAWSLVNNAILGVSRGFVKKLELIGVGYKCEVNDWNKLILKIGYSHDIVYNVPEDVKVFCIRSNIIYLFGIDLRKVNQVAAQIKRYKVPDPYKGKGIKYQEEIIKIKEGKKR